MSLTELRAILHAGTSRRARAGLDVWLLDTGPWWRLFRDFAGLERTKSALLAAVWRLPEPVFMNPSIPLDNALVPFVEQMADGWRLNRSRSAEEFRRTEPVSVFGNWQLYVSPQPVAAHIDALRTPAEEVLGFMERNKIRLFVDAFHDDTEWLVAIREPASAT
jgi:hypothetical protein